MAKGCFLTACFLCRQKVGDFDTADESTNPAPRQCHSCAEAENITEQLLKDTLNSLAKLASAGSPMFFLHLTI